MNDALHRELMDLREQNRKLGEALKFTQDALKQAQQAIEGLGAQAGLEYIEGLGWIKKEKVAELKG